MEQDRDKTFRECIQIAVGHTVVSLSPSAPYPRWWIRRERVAEDTGLAGRCCELDSRHFQTRTALITLLSSDAEVSSLVPRPKHFGFELVRLAFRSLSATPANQFPQNLDCLDFIRNCTAAYPYEEYLQEEFNGNEETRLWNMRDIAALITSQSSLFPPPRSVFSPSPISAPSNLVQSRLPKLREVWAAATTARVRAQETRSLTWLLREETIAANLGPEALERADFLHGNMAPLIGQVCLAQFIVHTIVKGWVAEGSLGAEARDVWEECVRQTRRSIRFLAQSYQVRSSKVAGGFVPGRERAGADSIHSCVAVTEFLDSPSSEECCHLTKLSANRGCARLG